MQLRIPTCWKRTSRYSEKLRSCVLENGRLAKYAVGYPLYYIVNGNDECCCCAKCASNLYRWASSDHSKVVDVDVNWEEKDFYCDCGDLIESAYAEDEE